MMLCVLIYARTGCGLRTVVSLIGIFEEVLGDAFGKLPVSKIAVYSDALKQNFKVRLADVKLSDIDLWARENLSPNRLVLRSRTLNKVS